MSELKRAEPSFIEVVYLSACDLSVCMWSVCCVCGLSVVSAVCLLCLSVCSTAVCFVSGLSVFSTSNSYFEYVLPSFTSGYR